MKTRMILINLLDNIEIWLKITFAYIKNEICILLLSFQNEKWIYMSLSH